MLYIRMFVIMAISLYTSRVVLDALGVEDFGIYNIVGGIVVLFAFINGAMTNSVQRFLNFELGRENLKETHKVFSASLNIYIGLALSLILMAETIGLWFFNTYINIPPERIHAANWVYQLTIVAMTLNVIRSVYNAAIIAYERMSFYAYTSIIEAVLRLAIVYLIFKFPDRLISYAFLTAIVSLIILACYIVYCRKRFEICRHHSFEYDKRNYSQLMSFSGWSLFGALANTGAQQGVNILINMFFGVTLNAALGIANQVNSAVYSFLSSFQTAFNPQIIKTYAAGEWTHFINLIIHTSRYSYFLMLLMAIPLYICCPEILDIWLKEVPPHTVSFCRWTLLFSLIDAIQGPLWVSAQATGKIRTYQMLMSVLILLNIPISYVLLKLIPIPEIALMVRVAINALTSVARVLYLRKLYDFPVSRYVKEVVLTCAITTILAIIMPYLGYFYLPDSIKTITVILISLGSTLGIVYLVGLKDTERDFVKDSLKRLKQRI